VTCVLILPTYKGISDGTNGPTSVSLKIFEIKRAYNDHFEDFGNTEIERICKQDEKIKQALNKNVRY